MTGKWLDNLLDELYSPLLLYGISLTSSKVEAEDLVQEAVYRFLLIYDQMEETNYRAWLMRVMRNLHFDNHRKKRTQKKYIPELLPADESRDPLMALMESADNERLYRHIKQLKENYQEVLFAHYFLDLSVNEIASITNLKVNNVKVLLHRGRKQLREAYENEGLS